VHGAALLRAITTESGRTMTEPPETPAVGHPRGTLAVIAVYALLFMAGWLAIYLFTYTPRGPLQP
jgi:hypothetical protein